ncbi:hypothetical protein DBX24_02615 [Bergeyella cardium]|uniref:DUF1834 family protein n=2 Tax=Bergeyella cardium TaxID=1585976 RepID=A0A6P1QRZ1_9FLAO|nr:hypothetical protein DBX24_02615 [Bergeyella cardium]
MINEILMSIKDKLNEVSALKYIDENWGQLDLYGNDIPVQWPCALVTLLGGQFSDIGKDYRAAPENRQEAILSFEITIAQLKLTNSSNRAPISQQQKAFEVWNIVQEVHQKLHGWRPSKTTGKLIRSELSSTRRDDGVQEIKISYTIGLHNC